MAVRGAVILRKRHLMVVHINRRPCDGGWGGGGDGLFFRRALKMGLYARLATVQYSAQVLYGTQFYFGTINSLLRTNTSCVKCRL